MVVSTINKDADKALKNISLSSDSVLAWPSAEQVAKAIQDDAGITLTWVIGWEFDSVSTTEDGQLRAHADVETEEVTLVEITSFGVMDELSGSYVFRGCTYDEVVNEDETISYVRKEYKVYVESPRPHYHRMDS
ncbi:MAG: hypothetical protein JWN12_734 [Candidatus Saccharibacteria bacterium]|nr:hypothetical protein [Candidatus Saccharibacteria bacterium]